MNEKNEKNRNKPRRNRKKPGKSKVNVNVNIYTRSAPVSRWGEPVFVWEQIAFFFGQKNRAHPKDGL